MRFLILAFALTATACAKEEPAATGLAAGTFTSGDRDALCIAGEAGAQRAGFVTYGADDANCSASGRLEAAGTGWILIPAGDSNCRISLSVSGERIALGPATPGCAYYCGPSVTFAGKSFERALGAKSATDFAGDPLC